MSARRSNSPLIERVAVAARREWRTRLARLATESGMFPVFEAERGEVTGVSKIRRRVPIEDYLKPQKRFAHLFGNEPDTATIARLQAMADRNIRRFGLLAQEV